MYKKKKHLKKGQSHGRMVTNLLRTCVLSTLGEVGETPTSLHFYANRAFLLTSVTTSLKSHTTSGSLKKDRVVKQMAKDPNKKNRFLTIMV